jgi:biotin carboxyl carrier protein
VDDVEPATAARVTGGSAAPTHLSFAHRQAPPPRLHTPPISHPPYHSAIQPLPPLPVRAPTERSVSQGSEPKRMPTERSVNAAPLPVARAVTKRETPAPRHGTIVPKAEAPKAESRSVAARPPTKTPHQPSVAAPAPQAPPQAQAPGLPPQLPPGVGAIDPLAVPVPPELAAPIYSWVRRLALQADLKGADRVIRDALAELTSSLSVSIVYPGQDGLWSLGADEEIPRDAQPIIAVACARRAIISSHTAIVPVVTTSETVAVIILTRNPRNPGYHPIEQIAMISLARESASIMHHLAVQHLQRADEIKADKGGLYRADALEAHRNRGHEGVLVNLTPGWVKRTYPILMISIVVAIVVSIFITVPTYATGSGVVVLKGTPITAPVAGTVDEIIAKPGMSVTAGQIVVRLHSAQEDAELTLATTEFNNASIQYLFDQTDEQSKKALASAKARVERAKAQVDTRIVRARVDGVVSDTRVQQGQLLQPGDPILTIVAPRTEPEIIAFIPSKDRPRLHPGMTLQVELVGFKKTRELATITSVSNETVGGNAAGQYIGAQLADSLKLQGGSYVIVKARLPGATFKTEHRTLRYYHGMLSLTEIKIQSKPFLATLLPALEKYLPD